MNSSLSLLPADTHVPPPARETFAPQASPGRTHVWSRDQALPPAFGVIRGALRALTPGEALRVPPGPDQRRFRTGVQNEPTPYRFSRRTGPKTGDLVIVRLPDGPPRPRKPTDPQVAADRRALRYRLAALNPGESILIPAPVGADFARSWGHDQALPGYNPATPRKFSRRTQPDGSVRFWRLS